MVCPVGDRRGRHRDGPSGQRAMPPVAASRPRPLVRWIHRSRLVSLRDRTRLVQSTRTHFAALFKIEVTLYEDPRAGCCGKSTNDCHWGRDNRSTRTGGHEQDKRLVTPWHPLRRQTQRREKR